jgi:uncharacterized protein
MGAGIQTYYRRMVKISGALLMLVLVGGTSFATSFDCRKAGLSRVEYMICANSALSSLDSQLGSVYAVAQATAARDGKGALLKTQRAWLRTRDQCSSVQCLRAAYQVRIAQLSSAQNVRGVDFELRFKAGPHGWEPECTKVPLVVEPTHVAATEIPKAFASFIPFVPSGWRVLDLRCADIKGDGSITYLLVTSGL